MRRIDSYRWTCLLTLVAGVLVGGCASWSDRTTSKVSKSPLTPLSEDTLAAAIEFDFVPIQLSESVPTSEVSNKETEDSLTWASSSAVAGSTAERTASERVQSLWQWVDETGIDPGLRRRLSENGLRIGRVIEQERFQNRLRGVTPQKDEVEAFLEKASVATESTQGHQRIQMRLGRRYELPVRMPTRGSEVALVRLSGETIGETVVDPQYLFAVTASQGRTSGELRLQLRPEIQHGSMKQTWVSSDTAIRIDQRRSVWSLEELDIELVGSTGDLFVISSLETNTGIGSQMFSGSMSDGSGQHTMLLVKLAHVPTSVDRL